MAGLGLMLASAVIIVAMAALLPIEEMAAAAHIMFLLLFVQENLALVQLRRKRAGLDRGFRFLWVSVAPAVAISTISSPRTMASLMEAAIANARRQAGAIVAVTVAEVPEGETLMSGRELARSLEPVLESAVRYGEERSVRVRPVLMISRRVSHGIVETVREEECNFLVIGQPTWGSAIERIIVVRGVEPRRARRFERLFLARSHARLLAKG